MSQVPCQHIIHSVFSTSGEKIWQLLNNLSTSIIAFYPVLFLVMLGSIMWVFWWAKNTTWLAVARSIPAAKKSYYGILIFIALLYGVLLTGVLLEMLFCVLGNVLYCTGMRKR